MEYEGLIYTKEEGIATIRLNRPERMNAFSAGMLEGIAHILEEVRRDDSLRVLVFTGTGRAFCTGADVRDMVEKPGGAFEGSGVKEEEDERPWLPLGLWDLDKPTIASINGVAVGGGFDLALACDIRIASDRATFAEVFIRRGLIPAVGGTYFLPRLVGVDRACELIWTGDMIDAQEAYRIGLVTKVVPHDELEEATHELALKLAKGPPLAIRMAKRAIYLGLEKDLAWTINYVDAAMRILFQTEDHREGARAFVEKREPFFTGR